MHRWRTAIKTIGALACGGTALAADGVALYTARYDVEYKGRDRGDSVFSVAHDPDRGVYTFSTSTEVTGMVLRLVSPNPILEYSEFEIERSRIRPLEFRYEDGSRDGEDNSTASFDWLANSVTLVGGNGHFELELSGNVLDRGTVQVALMRDAAAGRLPGPYVLADEDALKTYAYTDAGTGEIETALGTFSAHKYRQQREGSSRFTLLWLVPELRYLPVLIEQYRDGEVHTAFVIDALEWH
jgi:hypothetical protein